jgi:hypothetical protein
MRALYKKLENIMMATCNNLDVQWNSTDYSFVSGAYVASLVGEL